MTSSSTPQEDRRPILVGMNNPYGIDPKYALYPLPENSAGGRLYRMIADVDSSITMIHYRGGFERHNLCTGPWRMPEARIRAEELRSSWYGRFVILFGVEVRNAFGLEDLSFWDRDGAVPVPDPSIALEQRSISFFSLPHPSGRNPFYNIRANRLLVGELLVHLYHESRREQ